MLRKTKKWERKTSEYFAEQCNLPWLGAEAKSKIINNQYRRYAVFWRSQFKPGFPK
ncbi:MAG: hypothetical protein ABIL62_14940 [Planctomycetota bacterium]